MKTELTQERLKELLHYDPETGHFTWRVSSGRVAAGAVAGSFDGCGYRVISVERKLHRAHRLAFLYMTGSFPPDCVDHVNRDRANNQWANLRPATRRENQGNTGLQSNNTSGYRGVSWHKKAGKWRAEGACGGHVKYLGLFASLEEAASAAQAWREDYFGEYAA